MPKASNHSRRTTGPSSPLKCESLHFAEVEFARPITPRLVIQFSEGLSILVENKDAIDLAARFIVAFRAFEEGGRR